jgi:hypothetical protein
MSVLTLSGNIFCNFLEMETKPGSGTFERKFFRLDPKAGTLDYFSDKQKHGMDAKPDGSFNLCYVSMAADASSVRPKVPHCFYIVISGDKHYFKAASDFEKATWIEKLQDATRITVPDRMSIVDDNIASGFKVEVVGGVVVKTPLEGEAGKESSSDDSSQRTPSPFQSSAVEDEVIRSGYCTKQGVFRKSWKRRFFILTLSQLTYCPSYEDRTPIRNIKISDVIETRVSVGVHPNREHVFEVVTAPRVFYIQASSNSDRDAWIAAITRCRLPFTRSQQDVAVQTSSCDCDLNSSDCCHTSDKESSSTCL